MVAGTVRLEASPKSESSVVSKSGRKDTLEVSLLVAEDRSAPSLMLPPDVHRVAEIKGDGS